MFFKKKSNDDDFIFQEIENNRKILEENNKSITVSLKDFDAIMILAELNALSAVLDK